MARPSNEAIDTFMSITGAPESLAVQKLQEHGSDLNEAVNAHFSEGYRSAPRENESSVGAPFDDMMEIDDPIQDVPRGSTPSLLSESRNVNPLSLLDASRLNRSLLGDSSNFDNQASFVTHPRGFRQIPVEVKDGSGASTNPENAPRIEDVTEAVTAYGRTGVHGTTIIDNEDDDGVSNVHTAHEGHSARNNQIRPSAPVYDDLADDGNDIEEEMIRAAIEASKKESEGGYSRQNDLGNSEPLRSQTHIEDPELAHAVSLSIKMAEQEKALRDDIEKVGAPGGRFDVGSSSIQDEAEDSDEQPLIRKRSRRSGSREARIEASPPTSPTHDDLSSVPQHNREAFASDMWGGISSLEHDEAVMLEAAMFGGIPEEPERTFQYGPRPFTQSERLYAPRPPSPSLEAQRLIRGQQDDEYLASLQADREKEQRAQAEAEARRLEEEAAREVALKEEREREEENRRKLEEEEELERQLAAKEASLPQEPSADDENAITLLVRMPDSSRRGRRFLKSDKLQSLFDFIDIGRAVMPRTYRVVRPFPRRAFSDGESSLTLNELGMTNKQEALFMELI